MLSRSTLVESQRASHEVWVVVVTREKFDRSIPRLRGTSTPLSTRPGPAPAQRLRFGLSRLPPSADVARSLWLRSRCRDALAVGFEKLQRSRRKVFAGANAIRPSQDIGRQCVRKQRPGHFAFGPRLLPYCGDRSHTRTWSARPNCRPRSANLRSWQKEPPDTTAGGGQRTLLPGAGRDRFVPVLLGQVREGVGAECQRGCGEGDRPVQEQHVFAFKSVVAVVWGLAAIHGAHGNSRVRASRREFDPRAIGRGNDAVGPKRFRENICLLLVDGGLSIAAADWSELPLACGGRV